MSGGEGTDTQKSRGHGRTRKRDGTLDGRGTLKDSKTRDWEGHARSKRDRQNYKTSKGGGECVIEPEETMRQQKRGTRFK